MTSVEGETRRVLLNPSTSGTVEVRRYVKAEGRVTRYWAVYVGGDLLAECLYKKGAVAVAACLT